MNEYDPMKDNASSDDRNKTQDRADTYNKSDRGYIYGSADSRDGQGYTNPDGSHGFIYNPTATPEDKNRSYRGAVIAVSAVLATLVLGSCCFFGAYMAARSLNQAGEENPPVETGSEKNEVGTSGGLIISDDTNFAGEDTEDLTLPGVNQNDEDENESVNGEPSHTGSSAIPPAASIEKLPAERTDVDGDGKPEIETDANGEVLTSAGKDTVSVATVVNRVAASVVEITTETIVQSGRIGQYITSGAGSGVIISDEGFIVTNHHVIDGANTITVRLNDGKEFAATLIGTDEQTDIAVLWIDADGYDLTVATLGASFDLVVGEDILAIGNPLGSLGGTVTEGMISATAREICVSGVNMTLLQVSAPINPGNSGGGLFNLAGDLVGIVNAKMSSEEIEGLGFAIPIDTASKVIEDLLKVGYVTGRVDPGFTFVEVNDAMTAMMYRVSEMGLYVSAVATDSDAAKAGFQPGDYVVSVEGTKVSTEAEANAVIDSKKVGDTLTMVIKRSGAEQTMTLTLSEYVPSATNK
ncbi:MAG: trypsin-like peptidase domain-containing protein, partial [Clostridia bacterium]|nr:trypsin-like peptidase domain-containing protein [Clostridia bacterium]